MDEASRIGKSDALAMLMLLGTAVVTAHPILLGGYATYIDNTVHLAELHEIARGNEWSEIGFTGFAVGTLHSPLWYGLIVTLASFGVPLEGTYVALTLLGFVAPAVAVYAVARRRTTPFRAAVLAYLLLIQPSFIWGIGAPLGGMWTHTLGLAAVVLLADVLSRERLSFAEHLVASALLAVVGLTHFFALLVAVVVIVVSTHLLLDRLTRWNLFTRGLAFAVAALASAAYWLTFYQTTSTDPAGKDLMGPLELLIRLFVPSDAMYLIAARPDDAIHYGLGLVDGIPIVLVIVAGVVGMAWRKARDSQDVLGRVGFWTAVVLLAAIMVEWWYPIQILGPVSWRLLAWVRIGLALSAIAALRQVPFERVEARGWRSAVVAAVLVPCTGTCWAVPLARDVPDIDDQRDDIDALWTWLRDHRDADWGRVYLQDTFGWMWNERGLSRSHLLVLTHGKTGLPQLGTYYGVVPFPTRWTMGEFGALYSRRTPAQDELVTLMRNTYATHLVSSTDFTRRYLGDIGGFHEAFRVGRFSVWQPAESYTHRWINPLRPTNVLRDVRWGTGDVSFEVETKHPRARLLLKTTYHPWWRLDGPPGALLRSSPIGHLVIDQIPVGRFKIRVWYEPERLPGLLTVLGWGLLAAGAALVLARRRRTLASTSP